MTLTQRQFIFKSSINAVICAVTIGFFAPVIFAGSTEYAEFPIAAEPSTAEWKQFLNWNDATRIQLWDYQTKRGKKWRNWSWGWRLGWIRVCGESATQLCREILNDGIKDRALFVRAEAASQFGEIYKGSQDAKILKVLEKSYLNPRNQQKNANGLVQRRILSAIQNIGGAEAEKIGLKLASRDALTVRYWKQLREM